MEDKAKLASAIQRFTTDEEFRRRLLVAPRQTLMAELGVSGEVYDALVALAPALMVGGLAVLGDGIVPGDPGLMPPKWGGWG